MGPWFVALLFNTSTKSKKQTHIVAHTFPHLAVDILNKYGASDCWVIMIKVGPFDSWDTCIAYLSVWTQNTRGRNKRLERGVEIYNSYCEMYNLTMWVQTKFAGEITKKPATGKVVKHKPPAAKRKSDDIIKISDLREQFETNVLDINWIGNQKKIKK